MGTQSDSKKLYFEPKLIKYGRIGQLTTSGTRQGAEQGQPTDKTPKP